MQHRKKGYFADPATKKKMGVGFPRYKNKGGVGIRLRVNGTAIDLAGVHLESRNQDRIGPEIKGVEELFTAGNSKASGYFIFTGDINARFSQQQAAVLDRYVRARNLAVAALKFSTFNHDQKAQKQQAQKLRQACEKKVNDLVKQYDSSTYKGHPLAGENYKYSSSSTISYHKPNKQGFTKPRAVIIDGHKVEGQIAEMGTLDKTFARGCSEILESRAIRLTRNGQTNGKQCGDHLATVTDVSFPIAITVESSQSITSTMMSSEELQQNSEPFQPMLPQEAEWSSSHEERPVVSPGFCGPTGGTSALAKSFERKPSDKLLAEAQMLFGQAEALQQGKAGAKEASSSTVVEEQSQEAEQRREAVDCFKRAWRSVSSSMRVLSRHFSNFISTAAEGVRAAARQNATFPPVEGIFGMAALLSQPSGAPQPSRDFVS